MDTYGNKVVRAINKSGGHAESHQGHVADEQLVMYCTKCGKLGAVIPKGTCYTTQTQGSCSCSWHCCEASGIQSDIYHDIHLGFKPYSGPVYVTVRPTTSLDNIAEGEVISMVNWGDARDTDWYIEFRDPKRGYCYLKEQYDFPTTSLLISFSTTGE
jgi:hypothetical protein